MSYVGVQGNTAVVATFTARSEPAGVPPPPKNVAKSESVVFSFTVPLFIASSVVGARVPAGSPIISRDSGSTAEDHPFTPSATLSG